MNRVKATLHKVLAKRHTRDIEEAFATIRDNWADYSGFKKPSESNEKEFKQEFETIDTIYRCIASDGKEGYLPENLKKRGTGIYWTWNEDSAHCFWGDDDLDYRAILTAKIDGSEVDWLATVEQFLKPQYAEDEVRLKPNAKVTITYIELQDKKGAFVDAIKDTFTTKVEASLKTLLAALKRIVAETVMNWSGEYDDDDLNDAIDHINLQRNRNMDEGLGEVDSTDQKMVNPTELLPRSAFNNKKAGWLKAVPSDQWNAELQKDNNRDFTHIIEQVQSGLNDVIVIEGDLGDGFGRVHLAYALGEKVSVTYFLEDSEVEAALRSIVTP